MSRPHGAIAALNGALSDVIDLVAAVKQGERKVPRDHPLHAQLSKLFEDMTTWAGRLISEDEHLGSSPLGSITSIAGRTPLNLWPGNPTEEEVRQTIRDHLGQLSVRVADAHHEQDVEGTRVLVATIRQELESHLRLFNDP